MTSIYKGSCLCGEVRFSVEGVSDQVANCHCSMCRKFHGAAFASLVATIGLKWISGQEHLKEFTAPNGTVRTFCRQCGSCLGFRSKDRRLEDMEIAIATFHQDIPVQIDAHIFTKYKANWCVIDEKLPAFLESRENEIRS